MKLNVKRIRLEMERSDWNQAELAKKLKTSRQNVFHILNRGPQTFKIVERLARIFSMDPKDLLKWK